jgi:glycosyltransferase involved in cell wall biosynthesis
MTNYQRITFVIPCRSNLKYLQQAVKSIETHYGSAHDIVILDDASTDGTWEWVENYIETRDNIITYRNNQTERVGHTVLYDIGFKLAKTPIVSILHSDMIVTPNYVQNMLKHLTPLSVVSATRIEPPLHPPGPEKYVNNFGLEPDEFDYNSFINFVVKCEVENADKTTNGIFAPWMIYKEDFISIGGHDKLFAPMELEDSDLFNRFHLNKYKLIQSRDAFVYHMTCRGSRFKDGLEIERIIDLPDGTKWYKPKDSDEYTLLRQNKFREWWRKWHTPVLHDDFMLPIVPKRYTTSFVVYNCNLQLLSILEPWCDDIYVDFKFDAYIESERHKTMFNISDKLHMIGEPMTNAIHIIFDGSKLNEKNYNSFITNIPFIVEHTGVVGSFEWDIFQLHIFSLSEKNMVLPFFKNIF